MGSDDKSKSLGGMVADEAKGLAVEVYKDAGKPVVSQVGLTLGSIAKLILTPLRLLADGGNAAFEKLTLRVSKKLEGLPPDRLLPPPATIAGPAALQYSLLGDGEDGEDLREMFATLLARSMDSETASDVHPAFVSIVSQLSSHEARLLAADPVTPSDRAIVEVRHRRADGGYKVAGLATNWGLDLKFPGPAGLARCISNLERLGLIELHWDKILVGPGASEEYDALNALCASALPAPAGGRLEIHPGTIRLTPIGSQFFNACVSRPFPA